MAGAAGVEDPPLLHAAIDMPASTNPDIAKNAQRGALCFLLPCIAVMRLLPEVSPHARVENENRKYGNQLQVVLMALGRLCLFGIFGNDYYKPLLS
jgi:hypothetical protein